MNATERNDHYGKLNKRFALREKALIAAGYKRVTDSEKNMAFYTKTNCYNKTKWIAACTLSQADSVVWADVLEEAIRH